VVDQLRGWIGGVAALDTDNPMGFQGSFYRYGDGIACKPPTGNPCGENGCCLAGSTKPDDTFKAWGCGVAFELNSTGGAKPVKSPYAGEAKCFDIALTGTSAGNSLRIGFTQSTTTSGKVAPFVEVPAFTKGWAGSVCFADVECPDWSSAAECSRVSKAAYDLQIQVVGAERTSTFEFCLTSLIPK
jgi:hypothetical protein